MKVLSLHSFKGGVGKTFVALNLAYMLSEKHKVCLVDLDLIAPTLYSFFDSECYLNDFLYWNRDVRDCLVKISERLHVIPASPELEDIQRELRKDDRMEMKTLERLTILKQKLRNFDFVILDTHPGISYSSVNSLILSDVVFIVLRPDRIDVDGTEKILKIIENLSKPIYGIVNRDDGRDIRLPLDIAVRIPCNCDATMDTPFFVERFRDHPVTRSIGELTEFVLRLLG